MKRHPADLSWWEKIQWSRVLLVLGVLMIAFVPDGKVISVLARVLLGVLLWKGYKYLEAKGN